jgi:hypothetical protein
VENLEAPASQGNLHLLSAWTMQGQWANASQNGRGSDSRPPAWTLLGRPGAASTWAQTLDLSPQGQVYLFSLQGELGRDRSACTARLTDS